MSNFNIINLNEFTWQLNIAFAGGVFSVFSLIYNEKFIDYGLVTFAFGVTAHVVYKFFEWIFNKNGVKSKCYWITHLANAILVAIWIYLLAPIN